jgi:hypothetical protein
VTAPISAPRVSAETRGALRLLKQQLAADYARLEALLPRLCVLAGEFVARGSAKGRQRVFAKLDRLISPYASLSDLQLEQPTPLALWAVLRPREAVILNSDDPGEQQDCVAVNYLLVGAAKGPRWAGWADGLWTLEVSDHALHQLIARAPGVAVTETLLAAHRCALLLPLSRFAHDYLETILLRAPPGVFICEWLAGADASLDGHTAVHLRAKTWLHDDQLRADQQQLPAGESGDRLGENYLRPAPLRQLERSGRAVRAWVPNWAPSLGMPAGTRQ